MPQLKIEVFRSRDSPKGKDPKCQICRTEGDSRVDPQRMTVISIRHSCHVRVECAGFSNIQNLLYANMTRLFIIYFREVYDSAWKKIQCSLQLCSLHFCFFRFCVVATIAHRDRMVYSTDFGLRFAFSNTDNNNVKTSACPLDRYCAWNCTPIILLPRGKIALRG